MKSENLTFQLVSGALKFGGERGIRTLEAFRLTHFPGVLLRPLGHLTDMAILSQKQLGDKKRRNSSSEAFGIQATLAFGGLALFYFHAFYQLPS